MIRSTVEPQTEALICLGEGAKPIRVLHVDDDAGLLKLAKRALQAEGSFQVETALSVQEAFQKMREEKFDVIVSDYMMPDKDGLAFLRELREKGENIPFIVFTGKGREEVAKEALNLGADQYLSKMGDPEIVYCELAHSIVKAAKIREAEEALRDSEEKFRAISESAGDATISIGTQGKIVFWNRVAETIFGYSANEMIGKPVTLIMPERFRESYQRKLGGWFSSPPSVFEKAFEMVGLKRDGKEFPLEASFSAWKMKGEAFLTIVTRDVAEQKEAWEALKRAEEEAKRTEAALKEMMQKLSTMNEKLRVAGSLTRHDVRNKLSIITGNVFLAKRKLDDNLEVLGYMQDMSSACKQIVEIFDFARNYEMLGDEALKYVDVGETVEKTVQMFTDLKGIKVLNECQGLRVLSDSLLDRLFYNLEENSLKYGEKITQIRVYFEKSDDGGLRLIYEDDGVGIPSDEKPHLFREGFGKGTGYGLYLIKKMMEVYGWAIQETGKPGVGVQFTITVPKQNQKGKENYQVS